MDVLKNTLQGSLIRCTTTLKELLKRGEGDLLYITWLTREKKNKSVITNVPYIQIFVRVYHQLRRNPLPLHVISDSSTRRYT
jgi:hypothetical protein